MGIDKSADADVLVVGAGPTGLLAAICLKHHGVRNVRIIDQLDEPSNWAKATAKQPRSLEVFEQLGGGILEELHEHGTPATHLQIADYDKDEVLISLDFDGASRTGAPLLNEQWHDEQVLTRRLGELGVTVERGKKISKINDTGSEVGVWLQCDGAKGGSQVMERIVVNYLVGCDGAHSATRHHLNVPFAGDKFPRSYALIHCMVDDMPIRHDVIRIDTGLNGWSFISPMPDKSWIMVFDLTDDQKDSCAPDEPSMDDAKLLLASRGVRAEKLHSSLWQTYFNVHSRQAERYSIGRVCLCGDAAHIHSPLGGQGMNMGLQDAHNLAWKLALVIRGEAAEKLLDSYHTERHNIDRQILKLVEAVHQNTSERNMKKIFLRNNVMKIVGRMQFILDEISKPSMCQTAYTYGFSDLCVESWGRISLWTGPLQRRAQNILRIFGRRIKAGDRIPNVKVERLVSIGKDGGDLSKAKSVGLHQWTADATSGTGFKALVFEGLPKFSLGTDQDPYAFAADLLKFSRGLVTSAAVVLANDATYNIVGVHGQCLMLIRPDGYVGLRLEPLSIDLTMAYFADSIKATKVRSHGAICKTLPDPVPRVLLGTALGGLGFLGYSAVKGTGRSPVTSAIIGTVLAVYGALTIAEVRRDR